MGEENELAPQTTYIVTLGIPIAIIFVHVLSNECSSQTGILSQDHNGQKKRIKNLTSKCQL